MSVKLTKERRVFEIMLIIVTLGTTFLLYRMGGFKMAALHLYFLPIVLSGYYLGRNSAGVLALFSALAVTIVVTSDSTGFAAHDSPLLVGLALTAWAAVLGLTAILVGTLCDERAATVSELEVAYVGVIEVLSKYLQSANPKTEARSVSVAQLSRRVAEDMKLPHKEIDDIRVGALLYDLGDVEITTTLINKAVSSLEAKSNAAKRTFMGTDLAQSLSSVLHGALPLLLAQDDAARDLLAEEDRVGTMQVPAGAQIIRAVRAYVDLTESRPNGEPRSPAAAIREMRADSVSDYDRQVLNSIERVVQHSSATMKPKPVFA